MIADQPAPPAGYPPAVSSDYEVPQHFQPWQIGMDPQIGGMGRSDWQTWIPSDMLVRQATAQMSPAEQGYFQNRKIIRQPSPLGPPSQGAYMDEPQTMYVERGDAETPYPTEDQQVSLARHEMLHAVSREQHPYSADLAAGLPGLHSALAASGWPVPPLLENDPDHQFTGEAEYVLDHYQTQPWMIPPPMINYFSTMIRRWTDQGMGGSGNG